MTDTHEQTALAVDAPEGAPAGQRAAGGAGSGRTAKRGSLSSMLLPELQQIAGGLGISTTKMKKSDLVAAIQAAQAGGGNSSGANGTGDSRGSQNGAATAERARRAAAARTRPTRRSTDSAPTNSRRLTPRRIESASAGPQRRG